MVFGCVSWLVSWTSRSKRVNALRPRAVRRSSLMAVGRRSIAWLRAVDDAHAALADLFLERVLAELADFADAFSEPVQLARVVSRRAHRDGAPQGGNDDEHVHGRRRRERYERHATSREERDRGQYRHGADPKVRPKEIGASAGMPDQRYEGWPAMMVSSSARPEDNPLPEEGPGKTQSNSRARCR